MAATYPVDLIAKRDTKLKMDRSIVKGWNVHFQTPEEVEEEARQRRLKLEEEKALEIYNRLAREAEEDDEQQRLEKRVAELQSEDAYNSKTGAYSGNYGQVPVEDELEKQQIDAILNEKQDAYSSAIHAIEKQKEEE